MAICFSERELSGLSLYCKQEGKSEQEHAYRFADHLTTRRQCPPSAGGAGTDAGPGFFGRDPVAAGFGMDAGVTNALHHPAGPRIRGTGQPAALLIINDEQGAGRYGPAQLACDQLHWILCIGA